MQEIRVGSHDIPAEIAQKFCQANNLDSEIEKKIVKYIEKNLPLSYTNENESPKYSVSFSMQTNSQN